MDLYGRFLEPRSLRVQKRNHATHELGLFSSKTAKLREIKKRLDLLCGQASQDEERTTTQVVYCFLGALVSIDDPVAELLNIAPRLRKVNPFPIWGKALDFIGGQKRLIEPLQSFILFFCQPRLR